jgi:AdoMet-dependent heme synthase
MILYSPHSGVVVSTGETSVQVEWPSGGRAQLSGDFAREFLELFRGRSERAPRLEALARVGKGEHQRVLEAAQARDGVRWLPLGAQLERPLLFVELLGLCNERCIHCYAESSPEVGAALSLEEARRVVRDGRRLGFEHLQLTGGDPLLSPHVVELAHLGRSEGYSRVELYTNGLALTEARADALAEARVAFAFSFYSHDARAHDAITQVPGSQVRTLQAIDRAVRRGLEVRAGVIAFDDDSAALEKTVQVLVKAGIRREAIGVDHVRPAGRGEQLESHAVAANQYNDNVSHHSGTEASLTVRWPGKLAVSYSGTVYPCIFTRWAPLGSVRTESLVDIVQRLRERRPSGLMGELSQAEALACADCRFTARALLEPQ